MPIICWGNLAKSADDTQRIEQAIGGYVEEHNENINAHQIEGSSLYMHRVNEKLDHLDGSIGLTKLSNNKFIAISSFESYEHWGYQNLGFHRLFNNTLETDTSLPYESFLITPLFAGKVKLDFSKNSFFQTTVAYVQDTAQLSYILAGAYPDKGEDDSYGFKIEDAALYAFWTKGGTEYSQEITGIDILELNIYRAEFNVTAQTIEFTVDGVLKYTATVNLPTDTNNEIFSYWLQSDNTGVSVKMYIVDFWFERDR